MRCAEGSSTLGRCNAQPVVRSRCRERVPCNRPHMLTLTRASSSRRAVPPRPASSWCHDCTKRSFGPQSNDRWSDWQPFRIGRVRTGRQQKPRSRLSSFSVGAGALDLSRHQWWVGRGASVTPWRLFGTYPMTALHHLPAGHGSNQFRRFSRNPHGASEPSTSFARCLSMSTSVPGTWRR
jgi:hypothetical protein